jgi:SAM-dependent methyltransferase
MTPLARHLSLRHPGWLIRRLIARDLRRAGSHAAGRLLDIGCGQMPYRALFPQVTEYIGIDRPTPLHPDDRPALWSDALRLPFADASFDTVLATQVLEHVAEPGALIAEAARVLRPGGVLLLTAPHIWELHEEPHDYFRFTRYGLAYLLGRAGMRTEEIRPQGGLFVMLAQRSSYFVFRALRRLGARALAAPAAAAINGAGLLLDTIYCYEAETLNYLAIARRPQEPIDA